MDSHQRCAFESHCRNPLWSQRPVIRYVRERWEPVRKNGFAYDVFVSLRLEILADAELRIRLVWLAATN